MVEINSIDELSQRFEIYWPKIEALLAKVYTHRPDLNIHLERLSDLCEKAWADRDQSLKLLDRERPAESRWYTKENMIGTSLYVDLFAKDLNGLGHKLDYLSELGITYVHLMPLFSVPEGNSDGGYAVSSFRSLDPRFGTIQELKDLASKMREKGMSLALDFIFNHTSNEHDWALRAKAGEAKYLSFYRTFEDRDSIDMYQTKLRDIFPTIRPGSFTWDDALNRWVWTSFNSFQWDLNYANPDVFVHMVDELLYLANCGVDILRLDAVAFIWKRIGTDCENLPQAHTLIQAMNLICRIVAPSVIFKSEAIVHPDDVRSYIDEYECQLSYNPNLMALLWESVATRKTSLLKRALSHRQLLPSKTNWVNYLRCHDDIGWCFDDGDAQAVGIDPYHHRLFLNEFYSGRFPGSFARGVPFQYNPINQDMRICGTFASLVGVEAALEEGNHTHLEMALARAKMLFGVLMSIGGIPLIYLGEELGLLNGYDYQSDVDKADDSRWVHRLKMDWSRAPGQTQFDHIASFFWEMLSKLSTQRASLPMIAGTEMSLLHTHNEHLLCFERSYNGRRLMVIANFSEQEQNISKEFFMRSVFSDELFDHLTAKTFYAGQAIAPYAVLWLEAHVPDDMQV